MIQGELKSAGRDCVCQMNPTPPHIHQGMETHAWRNVPRTIAFSEAEFRARLERVQAAIVCLIAVIY